MVSRWSGISAFVDRCGLFKDALSAHRNNQFSLSIYALVPQVEGVITDWIYSQIPSSDVKWRQDSKTTQFQELLARRTPQTFSDQRVAESIVDFILNGPVLEAFKDWLLPIREEFPNRHVVRHGKYDPKLYTEENSIKAFLVLDTLYHMMRGANANAGSGGCRDND